MLCTNCGSRQATVHIRNSVNGNTEEYWLCTQCAAQYRSSNPFEQMNALLKSAFGYGKPKSVSAAARCSECGTTLDEIAETGKVGCAGCYEQFAAELRPMISRLHASAVYVPNEPAATSEVKPQENELESLKRQLSKAVEEENYELAAQLRDRIRALEG